MKRGSNRKIRNRAVLNLHRLSESIVGKANPTPGDKTRYTRQISEYKEKGFSRNEGRGKGHKTNKSCTNKGINGDTTVGDMCYVGQTR